jgi:hypothetical protein
MSAIGQNAELPYAGSSNLANSLGALFNGGNVEAFNMRRTRSGARLARARGGGTAFSDRRRLKTNIRT